MKKMLLTVILFLGLQTIELFAQKTIATFSVELTDAHNRSDIPVYFQLDSVIKRSADSLVLSEMDGTKITPVPFQFSHGKLHWIISNRDGKGMRTYRLTESIPGSFNLIKAVTRGGSLTFHTVNQNFLRYQFHTVYPPAGIDTNYKRSGFIHPLWTPHGQELTRIQPPDHYHHYGILNPWTHTLFEGDTIDFWNIRGRKGTVRFSKFTSTTAGPVFADMEALHEHVVFKKNGGEKVALNELQTVRVYHPGDNREYYIVDIISKMSCASQSPLLLLTYRYGG